MCLKDRFSNFVAVILNDVKTSNGSGYNTGSYECIYNMEDYVKTFNLLNWVRDDGNTFRTS